VDETATGSANFFGPVSLGSVLVGHFHPPSIDPGIIALIWAVVLGAFIYFGLLAVGTSGAFAIVIAMVSFAGIWLFVRTRGDSA
jgi:hypothetical protein